MGLLRQAGSILRSSRTVLRLNSRSPEESDRAPATPRRARRPAWLPTEPGPPDLARTRIDPQPILGFDYEDPKGASRLKARTQNRMSSDGSVRQDRVRGSRSVVRSVRARGERFASLIPASRTWPCLLRLPSPALPSSVQASRGNRFMDGQAAGVLSKLRLSAKRRITGSTIAPLLRMLGRARAEQPTKKDRSVVLGSNIGLKLRDEAMGIDAHPDGNYEFPMP